MLDTNVLVSALLRREGPPAKVLDLILARQVTAGLDHRIFAEYREVLARPDLGLPQNDTTELLEFLWLSSERVQALPLPVRLPDPDDAMFIEVAVTAMADFLVTGNVRHFPPGERHGVRVLSPREWLDIWSGPRP